jgi:hypothetical protein
MDALNPPPAVLAKIGSLAVHMDELISDGHHFDRIAIESLLRDDDVQAWLKEMDALSLIPKKRKE